MSATYDLTTEMDFTGMDFESLIGDTPLRLYKNSPKEAFSFYKEILPMHKRTVPLNIQGCGVWSANTLKRIKIFLPDVTEHVHRPLLVKYYRSKGIVSAMPHCTFTRPLQPKIKPGYSLHNIIL